MLLFFALVCGDGNCFINTNIISGSNFREIGCEQRRRRIWTISAGIVYRVGSEPVRNYKGVLALAHLCILVIAAIQTNITNKKRMHNIHEYTTYKFYIHNTLKIIYEKCTHSTLISHKQFSFCRDEHQPTQKCSCYTRKTQARHKRNVKENGLRYITAID